MMGNTVRDTPTTTIYGHGTSDVHLLRLRSAGMFSNVNEVIEHLRLAQAGGYRFVIDWTESAYSDPGRSGDPWTYYFAPCFPDAVLPEDPVHLPRGAPVACTCNNIITPRLRDSDCNPLLLPRDRVGAGALTNAHLTLHPDVVDAIERFQAKAFGPEMIGLHICGPGRTDGGVPDLRRQYGDAGTVPLDPFCAAVDRAAQARPQARIFVCSDASQVIDALKARYGARLVTYDATRSPFGEMHANHPENAGEAFPRYKLGLDVLVEAHLLSRVNMLVHGNSNVTNLALCQVPALAHEYIAA